MKSSLQDHPKVLELLQDRNRSSNRYFSGGFVYNTIKYGDKNLKENSENQGERVKTSQNQQNFRKKEIGI